MKFINLGMTGVFLALFAFMCFTGTDSDRMVLAVTFLPFVPINYLILKLKGYRLTFLFLVLSWIGTVLALFLPTNPDKEHPAYTWNAQEVKAQQEYAKELQIYNEELKKRRKVFEQDPYIKQCFDEGLFTALHETDTLTIVNVADTMYSAFLHEYKDDRQIGIILSAKDVKRIIDINDRVIFNILQQRKTERDEKRFLWTVDENALNNTRALKAQTLAEGPSPDIDVEMEYALGVRKRPA